MMVVHMIYHEFKFDFIYLFGSYSNIEFSCGTKTNDMAKERHYISYIFSGAIALTFWEWGGIIVWEDGGVIHSTLFTS